MFVCGLDESARSVTTSAVHSHVSGLWNHYYVDDNVWNFGGALTNEDIEKLLRVVEGTVAEFKEAKRRYDFDVLADYCVAIANEGGGNIVLGVSDGRPRTVVGTEAFSEPGRTEAGLYDRLGQRVRIEEVEYKTKRLLIVHVPARAPGSAWNHKGVYLMRAGDALVPMTDEVLQAIHAETARDFSAEPCSGASLSDLDGRAVQEFKRRWARRDRNPRIEQWSDREVLRNAELLRESKLTNAAIILFGSRDALARHIPQAEVVFEYRASEAAGPAQDRAEFREGLFNYHDALWEHVNRRNDVQSYQDGLFRVEVPTFDEAVIREAILNAMCHRDYRSTASVFVKQYPRRLEVSSPGGFPPGVTPENVLDEQNPRNRRLAEALSKCGLIERAGQGINLMFERSVRQSKPLPDFKGTGPREVRVTLSGNVTNPAFLRFFERLDADRLASFDTRDLLVLDYLQRDTAVPPDLRNRIPRLVELGVVEAIGKGRGTQYLLSSRFYAAIGQRGTYTKRRGLDREHNKALLLKHLKEQAGDGCPMSELQQVIPAKSQDQLKKLLYELRDEGKVGLKGQRRWAKWYYVRESSPDYIG